MNKITFRDFLRTPKSFLPPPVEGLEITRRDGDSFFIYPNVRQDVRQDVRQTSTMPIENKPIDKETLTPKPQATVVPVVNGPYRGKPAGAHEELGDITWEWCKALACHPFVPNEVKECVFVNSVDGDGNPANMGGKAYSQAFICLDCIEYLDNHAPVGVGFEQSL